MGAVRRAIQAARADAAAARWVLLPMFVGPDECVFADPHDSSGQSWVHERVPGDLANHRHHLTLHPSLEAALAATQVGADQCVTVAVLHRLKVTDDGVVGVRVMPEFPGSNRYHVIRLDVGASPTLHPPHFHGERLGPFTLTDGMARALDLMDAPVPDPCACLPAASALETGDA
jgi:hypothetical protein